MIQDPGVKQGREDLILIIQYQSRISFIFSFRERQGLEMMVRRTRDVF